MIKKEHIQGFIVGIILATTITAYAAARITLVNGGGVEIGTTANPLYAEAV